MEEKRKHKRLGTRESASLLGGDGSEHHVSVHDVSLGGMRILLGSELKLGTKISGRFKILPKIGPFYVTGQVV
ncbi:MAG: PilZ domain-containing protein, partial [Candidatus Omnitrophica bacterium]|nr:PilZ domain-containing protein [Candidatus Omnitrophota bacterium]